MADDLDRLRQALNDVDWAEIGRSILGQAAVLIGGQATTKYMRTGGTGVSARNPQTGEGSLRRGTGRLARSLTGARSAQGNPGSARGAPEGIFDLTPTPKGWRMEYGTKVVYAATHEYGDRRTVTARQRRFFWARHAETGKDRWKAMALSDTLTYPKRPYLEPALGDKLSDVQSVATDEILKALTD